MELTKELREKTGGAQPEEELKASVEETKKNGEDIEGMLDDADVDQVGGGKGLRTKRQPFG